ncbi:unnamed protein product, partial [Chrysoparadoxa australica]
ADQSVVESFSETGIKESGQQVINWFVLIGAFTAHYFIFRWWGIMSLLIPPFLFLLGQRIIWKTRVVSLIKTFSFTLFYLLWVSISIGYFLLNSDDISEWGFLSGGVGFEMAIIIESLMGWGTILFLIFLFIVFNMYFFNITQLDVINNFVQNTRDKLRNFSFKPGSENSTLESILTQIKEEVEAEEKGEHEKEEDLTEEWQVTEEDLKKEEPKEELELAVEPPKQDEPAEDLEMEVEVGKDDEARVSTNENYDPTLDLPRYKYPTPDLLIDYPKKDVQVTKDELEQNKDKIVRTLVNFKIGISSIKATIGPTVTLYEIVPEAGGKISKIKNLEDDIALNLAALGIRIIAPIPGRGTIGIEVPNKNREMVDVRSVITTEKFMKSDKELPIVLGKTISNEV